MAGRAAWTDPRLRAAWALRDWAVIFKRFRQVQGLSQDQLGARVGMPQPHISDIERGRRRIISADVVERITRGLDVPQELGGISARSDLTEWMPSPELRERIARVVATGRADIRVADRIAVGLAEHRRTEDAVGGQEMWSVVRAQLDAVTRMIPDTRGADTDRVLSLAAEHAHWLSWVSYQRGRRGTALAWLDLASGWALEAGASDLTSWVTRVRSYYTLRWGNPLQALRTAEIARRAPGSLSPAAEAIAAHAEAMAAAAAAERDRALRAADDALALALRAADEGDRPAWLYWLDPVRAGLQRADVAFAVRDWGTAAAAYAEGVPQLEEFPRDQAYYQVRLDEARARA